MEVPHADGNKGKTYRVRCYFVGSVNNRDGLLRLALGTDRAGTADTRAEWLKRAIDEGPNSTYWIRLKESLPEKTFTEFADRAGYAASASALAQPTWLDLVAAYRASTGFGELAASTQKRYLGVIEHASSFLAEHSLSRLYDIVATPALTDRFKTWRLGKISEHVAAQKWKSPRYSGASVHLDIAVLHAMFEYGKDVELLHKNPIKPEEKPGNNPKNGARALNDAEIEKLWKAAQLSGDTFIIQVLFYTGLRASDAIRLTWADVKFDRGINGEIELVAQKNDKTVIIPLAPELRDAMEAEISARVPKLADRVLFNPYTKSAMTSRPRLWHRISELGKRAGVHVHPHCFRDSFITRQIDAGSSLYAVAQMVGDAVATIEKHYASFSEAQRDEAQQRMAGQRRLSAIAAKGQRTGNVLAFAMAGD